MLYEMIFLGKIQRTGKTAPDKPLPEITVWIFGV
jgi:hypothetical protein